MFEIRSNSDCLLLKTKKSDFSHGNCAYACVSLWEIFISERIQFFHSFIHQLFCSAKMHLLECFFLENICFSEFSTDSLLTTIHLCFHSLIIFSSTITFFLENICFLKNSIDLIVKAFIHSFVDLLIFSFITSAKKHHRKIFL
jgi:hypothetical protein